jgi:hypothetical protein
MDSLELTGTLFISESCACTPNVQHAASVKTLDSQRILKALSTPFQTAQRQNDTDGPSLGGQRCLSSDPIPLGRGGLMFLQRQMLVYTVTQLNRQQR